MSVEKGNCLTCYYLHKRPGIGNYFIYTCQKFGVVTKRYTPYRIVSTSIGEKCPFFMQKEEGLVVKKDPPDDRPGGINIVV